MSSELDEPAEIEVKEGASSKTVTKKAKPKRRKQSLTINLTNCKYDSVRRVARRFGLQPVGDDEEWIVFWIDTSVMLDRVMNMKRYQKINHFPGMSEICRKDLLARNMNRMLKFFPQEFNIFPKSWCMPADYSDFKAYCRAHKSKTFITKPENSSQGKGIIVFKNPKEIRAGEHSVVQQYITKPFIIDGFKFDLRVYVVVTSCDPFRIYVYKDGLARFATMKYHDPTAGNLSKQCMHLTNYAINKHSKDFVRDDDSGSKRRITTVNQWFVDNGYDLKKIWNDIDDVIIKTLIAAHPTLKHNYRSCFPNHNTGSACFEILGFDILLDSKLKPWLIEVNHSPSFHTDAPLDKEVKEGLLFDTFNIVDLYANDKRKCEEEDRRKVQERLLPWHKSKDPCQPTDEDTRAKYEIRLATYEKTHCGGLRKIYPNGNKDYYAPFFTHSTPLCAETAASKMRVELSRQQRQEIEAKQKELESFKRKFEGGGKGKSEDARPESPGGGEKKVFSAKRRPTLRMPVYNSSGHRVKQQDQQPCDEGVSPQAIKDEEELERLAALQSRDSLIRGLGVSEQLQAILDTDSAQTDIRAPSVASQYSTAISKPLLYTSQSYHPDSGIDTSTSVSSLPTEQCYTTDSRISILGPTPLNSLSGASYLQLGYSSHHRSRKCQQGLSRPPHTHVRSPTPSIKSLTAAYNRPPSAYGSRPPGPMVPASTDRAILSQQSQRQPTTQDLNAELFGLTVISAPIRQVVRKQNSGTSRSGWG